MPCARHCACRWSKLDRHQSHGNCSSRANQLQDVKCYSWWRDQHFGVVTLSNNKSTIIVVFRWINFVDSDKVSIDFANLIEDIIAIGRLPTLRTLQRAFGFQTAYTSLSDQMKAKVKSLQSSFPSSSKLVATADRSLNGWRDGHSVHTGPHSKRGNKEH